jgi:hypothetical protein
LTQFGTYEITRVNYHHLLAAAINKPVAFTSLATNDWDENILKLF